MHYSTISMPEFYIAGISLKTDPSQASKNLFALWQKFIVGNIQEQIPHAINSEVCALYTDYEGDYTQPYVCLIGCQVSQIDDLPGGMIAKKVPAATYAIFTAKGAYPESLIETWTEIWQSNLKRTYKADFELYKPSFFQTPEQDIPCPVGKDKEVTIYVGVN